MSTEQSESKNSQSETPQAEITQQATTPTPTTTPKHVKNPKRVAAGKLAAEKTRLAREQQKKAAAEAAIIIANNKAKAAAPAPEPDPPTLLVAEDSNKVDNSSLSTTQWIGVAGIVVSLIGIYYKREELKAAFSKKKTPERGVNPTPHQPADINRVDVLQPVRTTHKGCGVKPHFRGVKHLD